MIEYKLVDVLITVVLALIMFGIGLSLTLQSFKSVFVSPKAMLTGLTGQMVLLPILAITFGFIFDWKPELKVGLLILAVSPGGTTSNFITYLFNGNTALSISMTTVNSFLTLFTVPLIVNFGLILFLGKATVFHLPYLETILQIFFIIIFPASIGVIINAKLPKLARKLNSKIRISIGFLKRFNFNIIKTVTIILLAIVFIIKLFASESSGGASLSSTDFKNILPVALLFNVLGLFLGYFLAIILKLNKSNSMTIGIEVGLQNTTLAFLVAGTLLQNTEMQKPALVYAFFSFWTAIIFGLITKKYNLNEKT